jgi:hypothetical protein
MSNLVKQDLSIFVSPVMRRINLRHKRERHLKHRINELLLTLLKKGPPPK